MNLMMVAMVRTGPLNVGKGSFSERNMCDPAQLSDKRSFRNEASECSVKIISLAL